MEQQNASCVISSSLYYVAERACLSAQRVVFDTRTYNLPPLPRRIVHEVAHQLSIFFEAITCDNYCLGSAIEASKLTPFKS